MILYKKKNSPVFRYILAIVVFTLGLTLTVVDVYGLQLPFGQQAGEAFDDYQNKSIETSDDDARDIGNIDISTETNDNQNQGTDSNPTSVPEPSTIILLASGLGLLRMAKKKN